MLGVVCPGKSNHISSLRELRRDVKALNLAREICIRVHFWERCGLRSILEFLFLTSLD